MKTYKVQYTPQAIRQLRKLDLFVMRSIYAWIGKNLEECSNPRLHGKGLTANRSGQWRYRVNDYRLIAEIQDDVVVILIVRIAHRREVYG